MGGGADYHRCYVFINSQKLLFRLPALQTKVIAPRHEKGLRTVCTSATQPVAISTLLCQRESGWLLVRFFAIALQWHMISVMLIHCVFVYVCDLAPNCKLPQSETGCSDLSSPEAVLSLPFDFLLLGSSLKNLASTNLH